MESAETLEEEAIGKQRAAVDVIFLGGGDVGGTKWTNELKTEQEFTKIWIVVDNDVLVHDQTFRDASTKEKIVRGQVTQIRFCEVEPSFCMTTAQSSNGCWYILPCLRSSRGIKKKRDAPRPYHPRNLYKTK